MDVISAASFFVWGNVSSAKSTLTLKWLPCLSSSLDITKCTERLKFNGLNSVIKSQYSILIFLKFCVMGIELPTTFTLNSENMLKQMF